MANFYNLEGLVKDLEKTLQEEKAKKAAWKNVTYNTKKDGSIFKVMQKNINNATIRNSSYSLQAEKELFVSGHTENNNYISDTISLNEQVRYLKDEKKIAKKENYLPKQSYLEQLYSYDFEDIEEAISKRIVYLGKRIESLEKQIEKAEKAYNNFKEAYRKAQEQLMNDCDTNDEAFSGRKNELYYNVVDSIVKRFPY